MAQGNLVTLGSVMEKYANVIIMALRKNLVESDSIATRKLIQSIRTPIKIMGSRFTLEIHMEDYWRNVDQGQRPGTTVSVDKLERWITAKGIKVGQTLRFKRKGIVSVSRGLKSRLRKQNIMTNRRNMARAIQRKIYKRGTDATKFAEMVFTTQLEEAMRQDISKAIGKDIQVQIFNAIKV